MKVLALEKIKNDINKTMKIALKQTAIELNYMIEEIYERAIDAFYDSYNPKYYDRTLSTYKASDLWENPTKQQNPIPMGEGFIAGIEVSSDNIPGHPYNKSPKDKPNKTEWVFNRTYVKGIHGVSMIERRNWGKNNYWDKYRRIVQGKKGKYKFNQYKIGFGKTAQQISSGQLKKFNEEARTMASELGYDNFTDFKKIMGVSPETVIFRLGQMIGDKPKKLVENEFIKLRKSKNIHDIIFKNVFNELVKNNNHK